MEELGKVTAYFRHEGKEYSGSITFNNPTDAGIIHRNMKGLSELLIRTMVRVGALKDETGADKGQS